MPTRDPALTIAIARFGWARGHQHYRLRLIWQQLRKGGMVVMLLAMILILVLGLHGGPQDRNNAACPSANVEGSNGLKAHAPREADDLWHRRNLEGAAGRRGTMKCSAFQGRAHDLPSL